MPKNKVNNNIKLKSGGGVENGPDGLKISFQLSKTLTAGVALTKGDACMIGANRETLYAVSGSDTAPVNEWLASSFIASELSTAIVSATIKFYTPNHGSLDNFSAQIHIYTNNGGVPGTSLGSVTVSKALPAYSGGGHLLTGTFATPIPITPGQAYFLVFRNIATAGSGMLIYGVSAGSLGLTSSNSGGYWSAGLRLHSTILSTGMVGGKAYKANASAADHYSSNYFGIAGEDILAGAEGKFYSNEIVNAFTGLTPGSIYYLSNTPGAISTTPGTVSVKVGIAISATELLLQ